MCAVCGGVLICVACHVLLSCVLCVSGAVLCLACVRCAWWTNIHNVQNKPEKYEKHEKKAQKCEGKESVECFASRLLVSLLLFSRVTTSLKYDTPEARKEGHVARTNRDNIIIDDLHPPRTAVRRDREGGRRTCPHTKTGPKTASTCRNGQTLWKPEWSTMSFANVQAQNSYRKYTINVNTITNRRCSAWHELRSTTIIQSTYIVGRVRPTKESWKCVSFWRSGQWEKASGF